MNGTMAVPLDVRVMNITVTLLLTTFFTLCAFASARWVSRLSMFDIQKITVTGETMHNNSLTLRANVAPRISGTFFTADLAGIRAAFEAAPWVRRAVVRREFPNRLQVALQEHHPVAFWGGEGELRLVNTFGEVFEANIDEVDQDSLPILSGPEGQAAEVLAMFQVLQSQFVRLQMPIEQLELSGRGSWSVHVAPDSAAIELGRGGVEEVSARADRFLKTLTQILTRYGRRQEDVVSADLRHENGYAIRLRGVSTQAADAAKTN